MSNNLLILSYARSQMDACDAVTFNTRKLSIKCVSDAAGRDTYRILQNHPVNNEKKFKLPFSRV